MKNILKHKPTLARLPEQNELSALLQTDDLKEQANRIQQLMRPVFTLAITFDGRTGQVSLTNVGPEIPGQIAHQMLDAARTVLVRMEMKETTSATSARASGEPQPSPSIEPRPEAPKAG